MLTITLHYSGETPEGFDVCGHAGYAAYGEDIVCSAVSALTQGAAIGLSEYLDAVESLTIREGDMRLTLKSALTRDVALQAKAIFETMRLALSGVAEEYPQFVRVLAHGRSV